MENIKKYPKSINNRQCLGPCYEHDTSFIHPLFLQNIKNKHFTRKPICPTDRYEKIDELTNYKDTFIYDECKNPTHNKDISTNESLLFFQSGFTKDLFLSFYYNINSFGSALEWIDENKFYPIQTKERIINAALNLYGDNLDYLDDIFIDFYIYYAKEKFINKIYNKINQYIGKENDEILIVDPNKNKLKIDEFKIERINYISEQFLNKSDTKKFVSKYMKFKIILFENYDEPLYMIFQEHLDYIKNMAEKISKNIPTK